MTEEPHMIWANPCQIRCGFVQWFFSQAQMSSQGFSARGRRSGKDVSPPPPQCEHWGTPPSGKGGSGCRGRQPLRRRRNAAHGDLIRHPPRGRSADATFPVRGEGSWQATAGRPNGEDGTRRSETSSVIRLAGDRRMPPSPCAGKAFGGRPQGHRASLRLQNKKTKN